MDQYQDIFKLYDKIGFSSTPENNENNEIRQINEELPQFIDSVPNVYYYWILNRQGQKDLLVWLEKNQ